MDLSFLKSNRFWALVIACIVYGLKLGGVIPVEVAAVLETFLVSFIGVRTVDRFSEKVGNK